MGQASRYLKLVFFSEPKLNTKKFLKMNPITRLFSSTWPVPATQQESTDIKTKFTISGIHGPKNVGNSRFTGIENFVSGIPATHP